MTLTLGKSNCKRKIPKNFAYGGSGGQQLNFKACQKKNNKNPFHGAPAPNFSRERDGVKAETLF